MLRISRLTDYGTMILAYLAQDAGRRCSASDVAGATRISLPTVQKLLKVLARAGLVASARGADGGYALARPAREITAAQIVAVLEGPVAVTECSAEASECELESLCLIGGAWQQINKTIVSALENLTLADLHGPVARPGLARRVPASTGATAADHN